MESLTLNRAKVRTFTIQSAEILHHPRKCRFGDAAAQHATHAERQLWADSVEKHRVAGAESGVLKRARAPFL